MFTIRIALPSSSGSLRFGHSLPSHNHLFAFALPRQHNGKVPLFRALLHLPMSSCTKCTTSRFLKKYKRVADRAMDSSWYLRPGQQPHCCLNSTLLLSHTNCDLQKEGRSGSALQLLSQVSWPHAGSSQSSEPLWWAMQLHSQQGPLAHTLCKSKAAFVISFILVSKIQSPVLHASTFGTFKGWEESWRKQPLFSVLITLFQMIAQVALTLACRSHGPTHRLLPGPSVPL